MVKNRQRAAGFVDLGHIQFGHNKIIIRARFGNDCPPGVDNQAVAEGLAAISCVPFWAGAST